MFAMPLLVRMLIFITIEQCEQIFHCKTLQVGGKEPTNRYTIKLILIRSGGKKEPKSQLALFRSPTSHEHQCYGLTSGFTRLIMKTKYVCHGLISVQVNFHDNRTM